MIGPQLLFETLVLTLQHLQLLLQICRPLNKNTHKSETVMVTVHSSAIKSQLRECKLLKHRNKQTQKHKPVLDLTSSERSLSTSCVWSTSFSSSSLTYKTSIKSSPEVSVSHVSTLVRYRFAFIVSDRNNKDQCTKGHDSQAAGNVNDLYETQSSVVCV